MCCSDQTGDIQEPTPVSAAPPGRRLRIAVLNRLFRPDAGGAERYSIALVEELAQRHEIHVFAQQIAHQHPAVHYHAVWQPFTRPRWLNQLWFALATFWATRRGFDVVHAHELTWHGQVQTVHVQPVRHGLFQGLGSWRRALRYLKVITSLRLLTYLALEAARYRTGARRHIVAASSSLRECLTSTYPQTAHRVQVLAPGVSGVASRPQEATERAQARRCMGVSEAGPLLLFVGNDFSKKGLPTLLRALIELDRSVQLLVVGNPQQRSVVAEILQDDRLHGRVFFAGALRDVAPAYRAADVLVHPTREDSFAMVVLEAMAWGVPVVVSSARYCGIVHDLKAGRDAWVLDDPEDAQTLARMLNTLVADAAARQALAIAGLAFARHHLWSDAALVQDALYQEVAASGD